MVWEEYKERNEIEGMFGNLKGKLSGYVAAYREDMAMVLALVKFLAYNMYVVYFCPIYLGFYIIFLSLLPRFLKHRPYFLDREITFIYNTINKFDGGG